MYFRRALVTAAALSLLGLVTACGDSEASYPDFDDDEFPIDQMVLTVADVPETGMIELGTSAFDNAEAAETFAAEGDDIDARERQLEAQGRIRSFVSVFGWEQPVEHLGRIQNVFSQSTLFADEDSAEQSLKEFCDLQQYDPSATNDIQTLVVPQIAESSSGLQIKLVQEQLGESTDTVVCFRTGRVVHSVVRSGFDGTQDLGATISLARTLLRRVDLAYAGYDFGDEEDDEG